MFVVLGAEVHSKMPRKKSKAVPKGNGPVLQHISGLLGGIPLEEKCRITSEALDISFGNFYGLKTQDPKEMRATDQCLAGLEIDARQPRLATEVDVPADKKNHKLAEDALFFLFLFSSYL